MSKKIMINGTWPLVLPDSAADEWIGNMKYHHNTWEQPRLLELERLIKAKKNPVVFYIGAYKGDMAALLATWGARMVLVESTAAFWGEIKETWELNNLPVPLACFSGLISNETKNLTTKDIRKSWPERIAPYVEGQVGFTHLAESRDDASFPQITIDALAAITKHPDIVTMDIEGSELEALKGALATVESVRPAWLISVHPEFMYHNHGTYERELHDLLRDRGYDHKWLDYDHEHHWLYTPKANNE
jgi:FkbM family methyltransferase